MHWDHVFRLFPCRMWSDWNYFTIVDGDSQEILSFNDCILLQMILIVILIDTQWNIDINALL